MILDAFSSDAIPVHLLTREAFALYLDKLAPGGLIAWHISNRNLDLAPVVAALLADAGLVACAPIRPTRRARRLSQPASWIAIARSERTWRRCSPIPTGSACRADPMPGPGPTISPT